MPKLQLIQMRFNAQRLVTAVDAEPREDGGYILHRALEGLFVGAAPAPFRAREKRGFVEVLAYSQHDAEALKQRAELTQSPALWRAMLPDCLLSKPMPTFISGQCLGFELRACPVVRCRNKEHRGERDAFLRAVDVEAVQPEREAVYTQWLRALFFGKGVSLIEAHLEGFRLLRVFRQGQDHHRKARTLIRPDALIVGRLLIEDPDRFTQLLGRGVGRHRAFGFGMLQLRPC